VRVESASSASIAAAIRLRSPAFSATDAELERGAAAGIGGAAEGLAWFVMDDALPPASCGLSREK